MRALKGEIPRGLPDHRTTAGVAYTRHVRALTARLGPLPTDCRPVLREWGLTVVDLGRLHADLEAARMRKRRRVEARIRRQITIARTQLMALERHLAERANGQNLNPFGR